jgi:hypothetical protein
MDLGESLTTVATGNPDLASYTDHSSIRIWGIVAGLEASYQLTNKLDLAGRLLFRWASGDRKATVYSDDAGGDIQLKDSIDHSMWGADLGLRWHATGGLWLEGGWRIRDRSLGDGPVSFGGPQVKAGFKF